MASNVAANTKLHLSTLATLRAVFPIVDVYPEWTEPNAAQAIAVAAPSSRPDTVSLMQRAVALQQQYHFRYSLSDLVGKRVTDWNSEGADVLTDDFAPADLVSGDAHQIAEASIERLHVCQRLLRRRSLDRAVDAAVDDDGLAGEVAGLRRTQIGAEIADFVRLSHAAHRNGF